jgi:hypothetical protein
MLWGLGSLVHHAQSTQCEIVKGVWMPARPTNPFGWSRFRDAWMVLIGRWDAVMWPGGQ